MDQLISLLIAIVIFAIVAYGMYWICTRFLPAFPPALWICGAILLIVLLVYVAHQFGGGISIPRR